MTRRPAFHVTRQNGFYDHAPRVEIATGPDEVSPGCLVASFDQEDEYSDPRDAVEAALELAVLAADDPSEPWPVTLSALASIGHYPTADDEQDADDLRAWAERRAAADDYDQDDDEDEWTEAA